MFSANAKLNLVKVKLSFNLKIQLKSHNAVISSNRNWSSYSVLGHLLSFAKTCFSIQSAHSILIKVEIIHYNKCNKITQLKLLCHY